MIHFFKELYLTAFTIGFRFRAPQQLGGGWGPDTDAAKGVCAVTLIEAAILMGIMDRIEIYLEINMFSHVSRWTIYIAVLALYLPNRYVLITRGHGIRFERTFKNLTNSRKVLLLTTCLLMILTVMAFSIYSSIAYRRWIGVTH